MADLKLLAPGSLRIGQRPSNPRPGGWLSSGLQKSVKDARDRLGFSQAAQTSSVYESPSSHYSFYKQHRQLFPEQYWSLYKTSPDVRACIDSITRRIATWDWYVKPTVDPRETDEFNRLSLEAERVAKFLRVPNSNGETWQEVLTKIVTDLLVYDSGIVELVEDRSGEMTELVSWLGSEWFRVLDTHGHLLRYDQTPENSSEPPIEVPKDRICQFVLYPNNRSTHGLPLLESCITECITVLLSSEHAMLALDADEIPPGLLVLGGVAGQAAERARSDLQAMRGKDHRVRVITSPEPQGIEARWVELRRTPKDLELLQVVDAMRRGIWRVFGVMPVELGDMDGVPRAAAEVQMDVSTSHLISPILEMIQAKVNAQILPRIIGEEDAGLLTFSFARGQQNTPEQELKVAQKSEILLKRGVLTVNEVRKEIGYLPIEGGDVATVETSLGPVPLTAMAQGLGPGMTLPGTQWADADDQYPGTYRAKYDSIDFRPPAACVKEAVKGVEWVEQGHGGRGLRPETIRWARKIAKGEPITPDKARKMRAWLARHESDKDAEGFRPGEEGYPSPGRVAWALWCGDPGKGWSSRLVKAMEKEDADRHQDHHEHHDHDHHDHHGPCGGNHEGHDHAKTITREMVVRFSGLHPNSRRDEILRSIKTELPSDWQPAGKFSSYRTVDLSELADLVASYTREAARVYADTADECTAIVASSYGSTGTVNVQESKRAEQRINESLDAMSTKWMALAEPYYTKAAQLGADAVEGWTSITPDVDPAAAGRDYYQTAMSFLVDSAGLVGTLRSQLRRVVQNAALKRSLDSEIEDIVPATTAAETTAVASATFAVNAHRVTNWTGKLVGLSNQVLARSLESVMEVESTNEGDVPVVWWYEWVSAGGRSCPICADEGVQGFRRMNGINMYPGEDTYCGGNCRCVLVMWTEKEVQEGKAVALSTPAGEVSSDPSQVSYLPEGVS
jgi:hypothetical protein